MHDGERVILGKNYVCFVKRLSVLEISFQIFLLQIKQFCFINPQDLTDLDYFSNENTVVLTDDIRLYSPLGCRLQL